MKHPLFLIVLLCGSLMLPQIARSEAASREAVEALMEVSRVDQMIEATYAQMDQVFAGMAQQMGVRAEEQDLMDEYMRQLVEVMREEMSWERMREPMIALYMTHFTKQEVQGMTEFYRSELGQAMLDKMPLVIAESTAITQQLVQSMLPRMQQLAEQLGKDLHARRQNADAPDGQQPD